MFCKCGYAMAFPSPDQDLIPPAADGAAATLVPAGAPAGIAAAGPGARRDLARAREPFLSFVRYLKGDRSALGETSYVLARHCWRPTACSRCCVGSRRLPITALIMTWRRSRSFPTSAISPGRPLSSIPEPRSGTRCFRSAEVGDQRFPEVKR